jgi:hypothetical protein
MPETQDQESLDAQFEAAIEADDNDKAAELLDQVEENAGIAPAGDAASLFTDEALGLGGFQPVLEQLSSEQIAALQINVPNKDDLSAMYLPGTTIIDADHRIHLSRRPDVKRAARGLAIAAAGGVDLDSKVILSNSGRTYTIEDGECVELTQTEQPDMSGNVSILKQKVACKGHLEYASDGSGPTGGVLMRCLHQWALMFQLGYYVTASTKTFFGEQPVVTTEIGNRVGDEAARAAAKAQIDKWVANSKGRQERRVAYAQAKAHAVNTGQTTPAGRFPARREIAQYNLPDGKTVAQAVTELQGRYFTLTVELPINSKMSQVTTRVVRNIAELADAIAPTFAVAAREKADFSVVSVNAR